MVYHGQHDHLKYIISLYNRLWLQYILNDHVVVVNDSVYGFDNCLDYIIHDYLPIWKQSYTQDCVPRSFKFGIRLFVVVQDHVTKNVYQDLIKHISIYN